MADTDLNIRLSSTGGDNCAGDINKAKAALDSVQSAGSGMGETFGKKFSAIGLTNLNYALLNSIEYTGKAKPVIGALNMGFYALMGSVGATTSALFPYIMGATALVAIMVKMKSSHTDATEALQKQFDAAVKNGEQAKTDVEIFTELHSILNAKLTPAMEDYEKSIRRVNAALSSAEIKIAQKQLEENEKSISRLTEQNKEYKESIDEQNNSQATQTIGLENSGVQVRKIASDISAYTGYIQKNKDEIVKLNDAHDKAKLLLEALSKGYSSVDEYLKATAKNYKDVGKSAEEAEKKQIEADNKEITSSIKSYEERSKAEKKLTADVKKYHAERAANFASTMSFISSLSTSKNKELASIGKAASLATAYIDTYAAANKALASAPPPWNFALAAAVTAAGLANVGAILSHATGADYNVDRPMIFRAGENGPERVSVTPLGSGRVGDTTGGGNQTITNYFNFSVSGAKDPIAFGQQAMQYILNQTRGRGQIRPVGASIF